MKSECSMSIRSSYHRAMRQFVKNGELPNVFVAPFKSSQSGCHAVREKPIQKDNRIGLTNQFVGAKNIAMRRFVKIIKKGVIFGDARRPLRFRKSGRQLVSKFFELKRRNRFVPFRGSVAKNSF